MILSKYLYAGIAVVGLALVIGAYFKGRADVNAAWDLERTESANDALREKNRLESQQNEEARKRDEEARNKDAAYAAKIAAAEAAAVASGTDYGKRLRALSNNLDKCRTAAETVNPGQPEGSPTSGESGLPEEIGRDIAEVGKLANELAALVRDVCVPFANANGR